MNRCTLLVVVVSLSLGHVAQAKEPALLECLPASRSPWTVLECCASNKQSTTLHCWSSKRDRPCGEEVSAP